MPKQPTIHPDDLIDDGEGRLTGENLADETPSDPPRFYSTKSLAKRLGVPRQTIYRWRIVGFLPAPDFCEGGFSMWAADRIEEWAASGRWANPSLHQAAREVHGRDLAEFVKPEASKPESTDVARLLDRFEAQINATRVLVGDLRELLDVSQLRDRERALQRNQGEKL